MSAAPTVPTTSTTTSSALNKIRSSETLIIATVSTAIFTDVFIYEIVVPVLPFALTSRAGVQPQSVQTWTSILLAVYGAATLVASPICGFFADRMVSRRLPFALGLLALAGSTAMLLVGSSIGVLVSARILQGISAAVVGVVGLALLADTVGAEGIGQAMGYVGLSMSLGILLGPMLGGIVYATAGYNAVFAMAFGLIGLDCILRMSMAEKTRTVPDVAPHGIETAHRHEGEVRLESTQPPKESNAAVELRGMGPHPDRSKDTVEQLGQMTSGEHRREGNALQAITPKPARMPPVLHLLTSRRLLNALWAITIQASLLTALDSILPLFVRDTFHWSSEGAGLIFLPIVVVSFVAPVVGKYSDQLGPRWLATAGFVTMCPFLVLLRLVRHNTIDQKVLLCALLAFFAFGSTLVITPMMAEITYAVDAKMKRRPTGFFGDNGAYARAYGLFNMAWAGGGMLGPLIGGLVNKRAGWAVSTLLLGMISLVTAVPTAIWTGGHMKKEGQMQAATESGDGVAQSLAT